MTVVRMYESEERAREALQTLGQSGFSDQEVFHFQPGAGDSSEVIGRATESALIPRQYGKACRNALDMGHHIIVVEAPFGSGQRATEILDSFGPVNTDKLVEYRYQSNPTPVSDFLGLPPLSRSRFYLTSGLADSNWSLSRKIGFKELSHNPTPLSSMFGIKPLTAPKSKTKSFGFSLLSHNPTPLSSMLGMKTLTKHVSKWSSFGYPLISYEPTPLSTFLKLPVLSERD